MLKLLAFACALLCAFTISADARPRHKTYLAHPDCNITMPCDGVAPSARGEDIARKMGFGGAQKVYTPRGQPRQHTSAAIVAHPPGCPSRAFCGCGAVNRLQSAWGMAFSRPRELWLAANWFRFPRTHPAPGAVAVRRHHVFVLEAHLGGDLWQVYDANSGGRMTRIHARSIAGYTIVDPRGGAA